MPPSPPHPLPVLLSVPHAGLEVPPQLRPFCRLTAAQIRADGDVGAAEIYDLRDEVAAFVTTPIARAVLDMNRAVDDRRKDGIVKTHTCWDEEIWDPALAPDLLESVIGDYHVPYHDSLRSEASRADVVLALDCHTMAAAGPPVGPDPGVERPMVCIGDANGKSCPRTWVERMRECLQREFPGQVTINEPFSGGYITRTHGGEMPWMQIELSRTDALSFDAKRAAFLNAVRAFFGSGVPAR